jgi:hypothetical protein
MTIDTNTGLFTVAVFQDVAWAAKALEALKQAGFSHDGTTILAKATDAAAALIEKTFGRPGDRMELGVVGAAVAHGPLVAALQGPLGDLATIGLARAMRRVGFQAHDGRIFETLTARGGVLVAVHSEPRAADAIALFHSYGGGNAAIGAWSGRV